MNRVLEEDNDQLLTLQNVLRKNEVWAVVGKRTVSESGCCYWWRIRENNWRLVLIRSTVAFLSGSQPDKLVEYEKVPRKRLGVLSWWVFPGSLQGYNAGKQSKLSPGLLLCSYLVKCIGTSFVRGREWMRILKSKRPMEGSADWERYEWSWLEVQVTLSALVVWKSWVNHLVTFLLG